MARVVGIDHLVIRVSDFEVSRRFYDRLLSFLGFVEEWDLGRTCHGQSQPRCRSSCLYNR